MDLKDTKVVLTGEISGKTIEELTTALGELGAIVTDALAPDVGYVFAGEKAGNVLDDARMFGVPIREQAFLMALLQGEELPAQVADYDEPPAWEESEAPVYDEMPPPLDAAELLATEAPRTSASSGTSNLAAPGSSSEGPGEGGFGKGARVKIIGGVEGVGHVGEIFWWGESRYGEGMRAGVKGPDEDTT